MTLLEAQGDAEEEEEVFNEQTRKVLLENQLYSIASSLDRHDEHIAFITPHIELVNAYREYMWLYFPVHPAALDENNLRYYLCTRDGSDDVSALSISISLAVCLGMCSICFYFILFLYFHRGCVDRKRCRATGV